MTDIIKIPTANLRLSTAMSSKRVSQGGFNNDRQSEVAVETGNTCISETMTESIEIPTTNLSFTTKYIELEK